MEYAKGNIGRVFILRFDHGDEFLPLIEKFFIKEKIKTGYFQVLGALRDSSIVVGSRMVKNKNIPKWLLNKGEWEVLGFGTVFEQGNKPKIHIHTALGRDRKSYLGCLRKIQKVYITIECIVTEIKNIKATKSINPATGLSLIKFL